MPSNTLNDNYEISSEGAVRHWEIPIARFDTVGGDAASTTNIVATRAAAVQSNTSGLQLTGTVLTVDTTDEIAVVDFTASMVYEHSVRNCTAYTEAAESAWVAINIGDEVYYDRANTNARLSLSPDDSAGNANPLFGFVVARDTDNDTYPKGADDTGSTQTVGVMQVGAGAEGSNGV
jgi:hypothetical protein